ncbi:hypothetical protein WJX73_010865 [Symbiochloris irregularis]|uniref:Uncharacterized protein n=1 Tax=Symbiochloris irregularis TaxID=706552 RepID=A0AAW1PCZ9_9CHLO
MSNQSGPDTLQRQVEDRQRPLDQREVQILPLTHKLAERGGSPLALRNKVSQAGRAQPCPPILRSMPDTVLHSKSALSASSSQADSHWFLYEPNPSLASSPKRGSEALIRAYNGQRGSQQQDLLDSARTLSRFGSVFGDAQSVLSGGTSMSGTAATNKDQNALEAQINLLQQRFGAAEQKRAAERLIKLANRDDNVLPTVINGNGIPRLMTMLHGPDRDCRELAVQLLSMISRYPDHRGDITAHDFVGAVANLLQDAGGDTARAAALLLRNCASDHRLKVQVASTGGVCALVRLLLDGDAKAAPACAAALLSLCRGPEPVRKAAVEAGAVPALIRVMKENWVQVSRPAAQALQTLCERHGVESIDLHKAMAEEAADVLLDLIRVGPLPCQEAAAAALRALSRHRHARQHILSAQSAIPLVDLIRAGTAPGQLAAAGTIRALAKGEELAIAALLHMQTGEAVAEWALVAEDAAAQESAAVTLLSLAQGSHNHQSLIRARCMRALMTLLERCTSIKGKLAAARAIANLAAHPQGRAQLQGQWDLNLLNADSRTAAIVLRLIWNLAGDEAAAAHLLSVGVANGLLHVLLGCSTSGRFDAVVEVLNRLAACSASTASQLAQISEVYIAEMKTP